MAEDSVKQAFAELRSLQGKLQYVESDLATREQNIKRATLTARELSSVPDGTNLYQGVGKCYILTPKPQLLTELEEAVSSFEQAIAKLQTQKGSFIKEMQTLKSEINDLVRADPQITKMLEDV